MIIKNNKKSESTRAKILKTPGIGTENCGFLKSLDFAFPKKADITINDSNTTAADAQRYSHKGSGRV